MQEAREIIKAIDICNLSSHGPNLYNTRETSKQMKRDNPRFKSSIIPLATELINSHGKIDTTQF